MVQIANPIYDIVFKYLMSDNRIARLILSAIIGQEITKLKFRKAERQSEIDARIKYHFLDFSAEVRDENGKKKTVIIELQKSVRLPAVIIRFRRYLGEQYASEENTYPDEDRHGTKIKRPIPIISIYIMGKKLYHTSESPVVRVQRVAIDTATNETINETNDFVENLTHDSIIIQTPYLKGKRRTELEQLLSIFDINNTDSQSEQIINIREKEYPKKYHEVIRRLKKAASTPEVRKIMNTEDEVAEEYLNMTDAIAQKAEIVAQKEKEIGEKDKEIGEKDKEIGKKDKELIDERKQKEEAYQAIRKMTLALRSKGMAFEEIAAIVGKSTKELQKILNR